MFSKEDAFDKKKRLFISHASEDKEDFVRKLAEALKEDFEVWYDEYQLVMGCSLLQEISKGLAQCDFGIVVLSKHFFEKNWPQQELNGLFALEEKDKKVILPVWKGVSKEEVISYSPILADRVAAKAEDGVEKVINEIKRAIAFFERGRTVEQPRVGLGRLRSSLELKTERDRSERIVESEAGVSIAMDAAKNTINILQDQIRSLRNQYPNAGIRIEGPKSDWCEYRIDIWIGRICLHASYVNTVVNSAKDATLNLAILQRETHFGARAERPTLCKKENYWLYIELNDNKLWKSKSGQLMAPEQLVDNWLEMLSARIKDK